MCSCENDGSCTLKEHRALTWAPDQSFAEMRGSLVPPGGHAPSPKRLLCPGVVLAPWAWAALLAGPSSLEPVPAPPGSPSSQVSSRPGRPWTLGIQGLQPALGFLKPPGAVALSLTVPVHPRPALPTEAVPRHSDCSQASRRHCRGESRESARAWWFSFAFSGLLKSSARDLSIFFSKHERCLSLLPFPCRLRRLGPPGTQPFDGLRSPGTFSICLFILLGFPRFMSFRCVEVFIMKST